MINLLPAERLIAMRLARSNSIFKRYIELTLLGMAILAVVIAGSYYYLNRQRQNIRQSVSLNQAKIDELEPVQKKAEELSSTINTIAGLQSRDVKFSELLTNIGSLMPQGAVLTGLQFSLDDLKSPLVISAQIDTEQKAAVLRNNLASSELFSKAEIQTITQGDTTTAAGSPVTSSVNSAYKYSTVINAYFKDAKILSSGGVR
jgi:Tfp pilus assembly protein PilN